MRLIVVLLVWFSVAAGGLFEQQATALMPDQIFYNGKIVTVDSAFTVREAFALRVDRFVAVGSNEEIRALAGPGGRSETAPAAKLGQYLRMAGRWSTLAI